MPIQIRDPVHGFITLRNKELSLLGTKALQRLRGIRQLAMASLVYPGAVHTRFDHSLGVLHVAGMMAQALGFKEDDEERVRLAALLHDIGHGPFSHVSEFALERYANRDTLRPEQKKDKIHEIVTALMIEHDPEIVDILGRQTCMEIVRLLSHGFGEPVQRSVVSGPLDADKQDYLLRDSLFCGVQYGVFDKYQFHRSLTSMGEEHEKHLMVDPDGIHAVEQFVLAKYYLTTNVYRHKVRLITDQMISRAIILGIEKDGIEALFNLYAFDNTPRFVSGYKEWDDSRFIEFFTGYGKDSKCKNLLGHLRERRLLKRIFTSKPTDFIPEIREYLRKIVNRDMDESRRKIECAISEKIKEICHVSVDPDYVIYHAFDIKSVKEMSRNDEANILVALRPQPGPFEGESSLFKSIQEGFNEELVEIYAPVTWSTPTDRQRICSGLKEPIKEIITQYCSEIEQ